MRVVTNHLRADSPAMLEAAAHRERSEAKERMWREIRRWCQCGDRAVRDKSYGGEVRCRRCGRVIEARRTG